MTIPAQAGGSRVASLAWRGLCVLGENYRGFSVAQVHMAFPFPLEKPPACSWWVTSPEDHCGQVCLPLPAQKRTLGVSCLGAQPEAVCWQELEAIKLKPWAMGQAQGPELPRVQGQVGREEATRSALAQHLPSPETGRSQQAKQTPSLGGWQAPESLGMWF